MIHPVEQFLEWFDLVNEDHQDKIARFVLGRLYYLERTPDEDDELDEFRSIIIDDTEANGVIGKMITIRGLIDYLMDEKGSIEAWNAKIDMLISEANDEQESEQTKEQAQKKLQSLIKHKGAWLETASSWKKLSRNVLANKALHDWERASILKETI